MPTPPPHACQDSLLQLHSSPAATCTQLLCLPAGPLERAYEDIIRQTVEGVVLTSLHPRTSIMVIVQVRVLYIDHKSSPDARLMQLKVSCTITCKKEDNNVLLPMAWKGASLRIKKLLHLQEFHAETLTMLLLLEAYAKLQICVFAMSRSVPISCMAHVL
jgi:hypothetical protein